MDTAPDEYIDTLLAMCYEDGFPSKSNMSQRLIDEYNLKPKQFIEPLARFYDNMMTDLYKRPKHVKRFSSFNETIVDRTHQMDLMEMPVDSQTGCRTILMYIDVASRKGAAVAMRDKKPETVRAALTLIYTPSKLGVSSTDDNEYSSMRMPSRIQTDGGTEFLGVVDKYLKDNNVRHIVTLNKNHQAIVERFNQTIAKRLFRYMIREESSIAEETGNDVYTDWVTVLDTCIDAYNKSRHSTTKAVPDDVYIEKLALLPVMEEYEDRDVIPIGTSVRTLLERRTKVRATDPLWSSQAFIVSAYLKKSNSDPIKYRLVDSDLGYVDKLYYREELLPVNDVSTLHGFTSSLS